LRQIFDHHPPLGFGDIQNFALSKTERHFMFLLRFKRERNVPSACGFDQALMGGKDKILESTHFSALQQCFLAPLQRHGWACLNMLQMRTNVRFARFDAKAKKIVDNPCSVGAP
jgi:hypothetical protein